LLAAGDIDDIESSLEKKMQSGIDTTSPTAAAGTPAGQAHPLFI
jgi:hypothetical protein